MADEKFKAIADEWLGSACGQVWDDAEAGASLAALLSRVDAEATERAAREEREACAMIHENVDVSDGREPMAVAIEYRDKIRSRGQ